MKPFYAFQAPKNRFAQSAGPLYICGQIFGLFAITNFTTSPGLKIFFKIYTIIFQIFGMFGFLRVTQLWFFEDSNTIGLNAKTFGAILFFAFLFSAQFTGIFLQIFFYKFEDFYILIHKILANQEQVDKLIKKHHKFCWFHTIFAVVFSLFNQTIISLSFYKLIKFPLSAEAFPQNPALRPISILLGVRAFVSFTLGIGVANIFSMLVHDKMKIFYENTKKILKLDFQNLALIRKLSQIIANLLEVCNNAMKWYLLMMTLFVIVSVCAPIMALILANDIDTYTKGTFIGWVFAFAFLYAMIVAPLCLINESRKELIKIVHWKLDLSLFAENYGKV